VSVGEVFSLPARIRGEAGVAEELMSIRAAAERLGVRVQTVHWLIESGDLEEFRVPPEGTRRQERIYVRRSQVERLAEGDSWRRRRPRDQ
jgi:hypothetical protein